MINFIVCEDNRIILQKNIDIINKTMFKNNTNYRVYSFTNFSNDLKRLINSNLEKKVYILDIELEDMSGIDIARYIRNKDLESFIIISTLYSDYLPYTLKSKLMLFDFISKFEDYEESLTRVIKGLLEKINEYKYIKIKVYDKEYSIKISDVKYIKFNIETKETIIKTLNKRYYATTSFDKIIQQLDDKFIKYSDYYFVNRKNIPSNKKNKFSHKNKGERSEIK